MDQQQKTYAQGKEILEAMDEMMVKMDAMIEGEGDEELKEQMVALRSRMSEVRGYRSESGSMSEVFRVLSKRTRA